MEKIKASIIVQARMGARRLPGKVLLKTCGKTVLEHVIERLHRARRVENVIVATTVAKDDLPIVRLVSSKGVGVFCGSQEDVLDRYYQAARLFGFKHIVRITADCPLIDPAIIDRVIEAYFKQHSDYAANIIKPTYPDGQDVEVFSFAALEHAWQKAKRSSQREHVTVFIRENPKLFKQFSVCHSKDLSQMRWTLDEPEDWELIRKIFGAIYKDKPNFNMLDVLRLLNDHPQWNRVNQHIRRNEGYQYSLAVERKK